MAKKQIVKALEKGASDKRTLSTTQTAARALVSEFKPSQIAAKLGISTQKWTAVKGKIQKGKLFNPDLRDLLRKVESKLSGRKTKEELGFEKFLKDAGLTKREFKKQQKELEKRELEEGKTKKEKRVQYRGGVEGEQGKEGGVYYYKYHEDLKKDAPECKVVKTVGDYKQARAWWAEIGAGSAYFAISRIKATGRGNQGKYKYQVVDIRTNDERNRRKGKGSNASKAREEVERAQEIYNNYKEGKE